AVLARGLGARAALGDAARATLGARDGAVRTHGDLRLRAVLLPSEIETLDELIVAPLARVLADAQAVLYPTLGIAFLGGDARDVEAVARVLGAARVACEQRGGSFVLLDASAPLGERVDRFGKPPASLPLMRRIKERFDPERRLAPGRFAGASS
ncbi:MAG: FAD-binding oxidoreductase, partial [Vulcanimicrobiaceae bacterium]